MEKLEQLKKVLGKNPVIQTHSAEEIIANPKLIEQNYMHHASTHMSLGDAKEFQKRILKNIEKEKVFAGLTTGDFGLGKTSYLVNLWKQLSEQNIMAIPPFSWRTLDDLFKTITAWIEYRLRQENATALQEFKGISDEYRQKSFEEEVKSMMVEGVNETVAINILTKRIEKGTFILHRNISELLQFLDETTGFLKSVGYDGLVICLDELQITVSELSPDRTFQYLFELSNYTLDRIGSYGFMIGLPLNTYVQMQQVKADALDRFAQQRLIVDLSSIYNEDFAQVLWKRYKEYFDFADIAADIIDSYALKGLGEITDSSRKDIGNGPRSVISGFNAIIEHYSQHSTQYTLINLVGDILEEKILLGERSKYVEKVKSLIKKVSSKEEYLPFIYVLAGLPQGCQPDVLEHYNVLNNESQMLLKEWLGNEVYKSSISGYRLATLDEMQHNPESFYERAIRNFNMTYTANDLKIHQTTLKSFNELIVPKLLTERERINWTCVFEQETDQLIEFKKYKDVYFTEIGGTFDRTKNQFPNRHLMLVSFLSNQKVSRPTHPEISDKYRFLGTWYFNLNIEEETESGLQQAKENEYLYQFKLNIREKFKNSLPIISDVVEDTSLDAMFLMNFIYYLKNSTDIPQSDQSEIDYNISEIVNIVIGLLFTENLKEVKNSNLILLNHGARLLAELFEDMCKRKYPNYYTIMSGSQISKRLNNYRTFLENENITMEVKRGYKPLAQGYERMFATDKRAKVTERFNINSTSTFEKLIEELPQFFNFNSNGDLYVKMHPAEQFCLEQLKQSAYTINIDGKACQSIAVSDLSEMMRELGYVSDEIQQFYLIGALRKIFQYDSKLNVLYFKPLTIEEWKLELKERFDYVQQLEDEIKLNGIHISIDVKGIEEQIEKIENEDSYEQLSARLKDLEMSCLSTMNVYINRELNKITERFNKTSKELQEITRNFEEVEQDDSEEKKLWFEKQSTLKQELRECQEFYQEIYQIRLDIPKTAPTDFIKAVNGIEKFAQLIDLLSDVDKNIDKLRDGRKALKLKQEQWLEWENYFNSRIDLSNLINVLKSTGLSQMMEQIDVIDEEVQQQFQEDNFTNSSNYISRLKHIRNEIHAELKKSREKFLTHKVKYEAFLKESDIRLPLNTQFNEQDQFSSYQKLTLEFTTALTKQVDNWLKDTEELEQRLVYLKQVMEKDVEKVEDEVVVISSELFKLQKTVADGEGISKLVDFKGMSARIAKAKTDVQNVVQKEELSDKEQKLVDCITVNTLTLEELILNYGDDTEKLDLEEVLSLISSLFKKNHINIRIEKGGNN